MEGFLMVPPDRGAIIGRAVWKPRYVILGSPIRRHPKQDALVRTSSSHRLHAARKGLISSPRPLGDEAASNAPGQSWLSVYKQKDDWEASVQHHVPTIKSCEIQTIQYRKPSPLLPTLIITFNVDDVSDKARKRRSSRTGGLGPKDAYPNSVLFRTATDAEYTIYDWQMALQPLLTSNTNVEPPMSPISPISPQFTSFANPFAAHPTQRGFNARPELHHRSSSNTYKSDSNYNSSVGTLPERQRSSGNQMISPSPSLRSRRSDLSSQASSHSRPPGYQGSFPIQHPPDLPSPASTAGYEDQLISGWTSAQGRSSALSTHTRGSNSVSLVGTPPAPTQTILDRAFQMRMIPGSERAAEDDATKMSSIARFEALMRETDERIKAGKNCGKNISRESRAPGWTLAEENEDDDEDDEDDLDDRPDTSESSGLYLAEEDTEDGQEIEPLACSVHGIPTPAQLALEYIAGRSLAPNKRPSSGKRPTSSRSGQHPLSPKSTSSAIPPPLPRSITTDGLSLVRPSISKRKPRPVSMAVPSTVTNFDEPPLTTSTTTLKRRSSSSAKHLSFGEFAKRLSSGSSLLLVQTNQSDSTSSSMHENDRLSGEYTEDEEVYGRHVALHRGLSQSRLSGMSPQNAGMRVAGVSNGHTATSEEKFGWRSSGF